MLHLHFLCKLFHLLQLTSTTLQTAEATKTPTHDSKKNKFETGCLQYIHKSREHPQDDTKLDLIQRRVCNSDDHDLVGNTENCRAPTFENYKEVRIGAGDWDGSIIISWIYQIMLSEILGVPTTIDGDFSLRKDNLPLSFYHAENWYRVSDITYPIHSLIEANEVDGDCTKTHKSCAHVIPSAWEAGRQESEKFTKTGEIASNQQKNGITGRLGFFVPIRTVRRDPTLHSYFGLTSDNNREKLAFTFKTPVNWNDYCALTYSNCVDGDDVAVSFPRNKSEGSSYFVQGFYTGHFALSENNNCTLNENNCTGHIVIPTCQWTNYAEAQLFWNDIHLRSNGSLKPNRGYPEMHIRQIYKAANATKSDIIIWWWTPDQMEQTFVGTDYEMVRVDMPRPTSECIDFRINGGIVRCSNNELDRLGHESTGACDYPIEFQSKIISNGLVKAIFSGEDEAMKSPAFDFLNNIVLPLKTVDDVLFYREKKRRHGLSDDPLRETLCDWVYDNFDYLQQQMPTGYPRQKREVDLQIFSITGSILGASTFSIVLVSIYLIRKWKTKRHIKFAQVDALVMTAIGYAFISIAGICGSVEPSTLSCTLTQWFTRLGYTIGLVPTLVKLFSINNLIRAGSRFQRADIDNKKLRRTMIITIIIWIFYLLIWTIVDIPRPMKNYLLYKQTNLDTNLVIVYNGCASSSTWWRIASFSIEAILLLAITLLAYICRGVIEELNESRSLSFMVYSHFLFLLMRLLLFILSKSNMIPMALYNRIESLLISLDTLVAIFVYFFPKFYMVFTTSQFYHSRRSIHMKSVKNKLSGFSKKCSSTTSPLEIVETNESKSRYRQINGVRIPQGGIPNLIVKKSEETNDERTDKVVCFSSD